MKATIKDEGTVEHMCYENWWGKQGNRKAKQWPGKGRSWEVKGGGLPSIKDDEKQHGNLLLVILCK